MAAHLCERRLVLREGGRRQKGFPGGYGQRQAEDHLRRAVAAEDFPFVAAQALADGRPQCAAGRVGVLPHPAERVRRRCEDAWRRPQGVTVDGEVENLSGIFRFCPD